MTPRRSWRALAPCLLVVLAACGHPSASEPVRAGSAPSGGSGSSAPVSTSSTPGSPVAGLSPVDLRRAVQAPSSSAARRIGGPVAEPIALSAGRTVWRVTIRGSFTVRDARVTVFVGNRSLGHADVTPDLGALVAVSTSDAGLVAGAPVTYQWDGAPAVAAGRLEVVR